MKIKQILIFCYLFAVCLQFLPSQRVGAKIKVPATLLIKENKNAFSAQNNKFEFEAALFSNCNPLNCYELSNILIKVTNLSSALYGSGQDLNMSLKGQIGEAKLSEVFKEIGEFRQNEVYKSLPWSRKIELYGNLDSGKLPPSENYSGNTVMQFVIF